MTKTETPLIFQNKRTKVKIIVIKRLGAMVKIKYLKSGLTSWYHDNDFSRMFELSEDFLQLKI